MACNGMTENKGMMTRVRSIIRSRKMKKILFAGYALLMTGCLTTSPESTAWNMAQEINTPAAYEDFIRRYPDSSHADDAEDLIEEARMDQVMKASTVAECVRALKTTQDQETIGTIADLAFKAALQETNAGALYDFLAHFKDHSGKPEIRRRLEGIEYRAAKDDPSPVPMEYFLLKYPASTFAGEGRALLAEKSYSQVAAWKNRYGYQAFLLKFPESPRAADMKSLLPSGVLQPDASNTQPTLAAAMENSAWLKRYGCAMALSASIGKNSGDVDSLRRELNELEKNAAAPLPAACSSLKLAVRPGAGGDFTEAARMMTKTEERRKELANIWEVYRQREEVAKTAAVASEKVADDLEAAELSEDVLGSGPLGGLEVGREKGSVSARKANERFTQVGKIIEKNREDIKRALVEVDALYRPLKYYIGSSVIAQ